MKQKTRKINLITFTYAIVFILVFLAYIFYLIPHQGVQLSDTGLHFYGGLSLISSKIAFSWLLIPRPELFNAFLMLFGIRNIWILSALGVSVLIVATLFLSRILLINKKFGYRVLAIIGLSTLAFIVLPHQSYCMEAPLYLTISLAFFYYSLTKTVAQKFLLAVSAIFLVLSCLVYPTLAPGAVFAVVLLSILFRKAIPVKQYLILFCVAGLIIVGLYMLRVGFSNIFAIFHHHNNTPSYVISYMFPRIVRLMTLIGSQLLILLLITVSIFFISKLIRFKLQKEIIFLITATFFLLLTVQKPFTRPDIYQSMSFAFFCLCIWSIIYLRSYKKEYDDFKIMSVALIVTVYFIGECASSQNLLITMAYPYGGLFSTILFVNYFNYVANSQGVPSTMQPGRLHSVLRETLLALFILLGVASPLVTSLEWSPGGGGPLTNQTKLTMKPFKYVYASKEQGALLFWINHNYKIYKCDEKAFLAFPQIPMLYYMYERSAHLHTPFITYLTFYPLNPFMNDKNLYKYLAQQKHWCIFIAAANNFPTFLPKSKQIISSLSTRKLRLKNNAYNFTMYIR